MITNYLEQKAAELGIGIQVRLRNYGEIADGQERKKTVTERYVRDGNVYSEGKLVHKGTGKMVLVARVKTTSPTKDSDRIKAMERIDSLTGTKEQREIDKQHAMSEYDELYKRMVGRGARKVGDGAQREANGVNPQEGTREPGEGERGPTSVLLSSSSSVPGGISESVVGVEKNAENISEVVEVRRKVGMVEVDAGDIPADIPRGTEVRKRVMREGGEAGELGFGASDVMKAVLRGDLRE